MQYPRPSTLAALAALTLSFTAPLATAQEPTVAEYEPVETGVVEPIPEEEGDFSTQAIEHPAVETEVELPEAPIPQAQYRATKLRARNAPFAENVTPLPIPEGVPPTLAATVGESYLGMNVLSSTNNTHPPDTILAKSGFRVLQAVNRALQLRRPFGASLDLRDLNAFFGASTDEGLLFDPKVYFDRLGSNLRLYVIALQRCNNSLPPSSIHRCPGPSNLKLSRLWLAVSRSSNPNDLSPSNWCRYQLNAIDDFGTANESWADFPAIGGGKDALVVSVNQIKWTANQFTWARIAAFRKDLLSDNASSCPSLNFSVFRPAPSIGDLSYFTLQPSDHVTAPSSFSGTTNPAYLVNSHWDPFTTHNLYRVWRVRNVNTSATLQRVDVNGSFNYAIQPDSPQPSVSQDADTGDTKVLQVTARGNRLWAVHGTLCNVGGGANESCVRMVRFDTSQSGSGNPTASIGQQLVFGGSNQQYYYMPGVAVDNSENVGVAFQHSGSSLHVGSSWTIKPAASSSFPTPTTLIAGNCSRTASSINRTGDYVGAQTNPNDLASFWFSAEAFQTLSGSCEWVTQIEQVTP